MPRAAWTQTREPRFSVFSMTRGPPGHARSAGRRVGASDPPGMQALSIASVRLSMRLIEASVHAARASIANNRKRPISAYAKADRCAIGRFSEPFAQERRRARAPLRANRPRIAAGTAAPWDTRGYLRHRAATAIPADAATGAMSAGRVRPLDAQPQCRRL